MLDIAMRSLHGDVDNDFLVKPDAPTGGRVARFEEWLPIMRLMA